MKNTPSINDLISQGLICAHSRINYNAAKALEANAFLYALVELLNESGLVNIEELDMRKKQVADRLIQKLQEEGFGLLVQEPECDKYQFPQEANVDCDSRLSVCKAICCKLPFALSRQDVEEGIIQWDFGRPYLIAHADDGYCVHFDRQACRCTVHVHRPIPCRGFDCQDNNKWKVWKDFDQKHLNPELMTKLNAGISLVSG